MTIPTKPGLSSSSSLLADIELGLIHLTVTNLNRSIEFY